MIRAISYLGCLFVFMSFLGCGPPGKGLKVEFVEGIIKLDGEPLPQASVTFIPIKEDGVMEAAGGYTNDKGVYHLTSGNGDAEKGAVAGEYRVLISKISSKSLNESSGGEYNPGPGGYAVTYEQTQLLPKIYQDRTNSPLTATVKKGKNKNMDFELSSTP